MSSTETTAPIVEPAQAPDASLERLATVCMVIAAMSAAATIGFRTVFSSYGYIATAIAGAALGAMVVLGGRRFKLLFGEWVALAIVAPLVLGPICAGGIGFYDGLINGWVDLLSAEPPVDATSQFRAVPFSAAYGGAAIGAALAHYRDLPGLGVVGPLATLAVSALFSEQTRSGALTVGVAILVGLLILTRLHQSQVSQTGLVVLAFVLALVGVLASTSSLVLGVADEDSRFDLRDLQTPPWDPLQAPSPLAELKASLVQANTESDTAIMRISGSERVERWRVASLPVFDGITWGVAEAGAPADFVPVDTELPAILNQPAAASTAQFDVEILASVGPWLPAPGTPTRLDFAETDARMSLATGTIGIPAGLGPGDSYSISVDQWIIPDDASLSTVAFVADDRSAELELLPPLVRNLAADFTTGLGQLSGERVVAIRDNLRSGSYDLEEPPGHSFGRVADFLGAVDASGQELIASDLRALTGYEELYAATGGVLVRLSDIPARVAVGYMIPDDRWIGTAAEVRRSDMSAWIEVLIPEQGWVPVDVTPERTREPEPVDEGEREEQGVPFANPPKAPESADDSPAPEEAEEDEPEPDEPDEDEQTDADRGLPTGVIAAAVAVVPIALVLIGASAIIAAKAARRRRRRAAEDPADKVIGAWNELNDRLAEVRTDRPVNTTPAEVAAWTRAAAELEDPAVADRVSELADHVTAAVFHPEPPHDDAAKYAWELYDHATVALRAEATAGSRIRRSIDPVPLVGAGRRTR